MTGYFRVRPDSFRIEIDDEGVCRVRDYDFPSITFSVGDFGHFLTRFLEAVRNDDEGDIEIDLDLPA